MPHVNSYGCRASCAAAFSVKSFTAESEYHVTVSFPTSSRSALHSTRNGGMFDGPLAISTGFRNTLIQDSYALMVSTIWQDWLPSRILRDALLRGFDFTVKLWIPRRADIIISDWLLFYLKWGICIPSLDLITVRRKRITTTKNYWSHIILEQCLHMPKNVGWHYRPSHVLILMQYLPCTKIAVPTANNDADAECTPLLMDAAAQKYSQYRAIIEYRCIASCYFSSLI